MKIIENICLKIIHSGIHKKEDLGEDETRNPPTRMSVADWHKLWIESETKPINGMKRLSIFHCLPYWNNLLINHLLDPMHIFKNVAESIWKHMAGDKDSMHAREDLQLSKTKKEYWPKLGADGNNTHSIPRASWILSKEEYKYVRSVIYEMRTPTNFAHSLRTSFTVDGKLHGLKSHDWLKMLEYIFPMCIRGCLTEHLRETIYKLAAVVRYLYIFMLFVCF